MLSKLMIAAGAFLMSLGGMYIGLRIEGEFSVAAIVAFAIGIVWLSQAPVMALRQRVRELESKSSANAEAETA